jgi:creatinine amidohydrolase
MVAGNTQPLKKILPDLMAQGVRPVSPSGVLGDPTTADAAFGQKQFALMVARIVREVEHG